MVVVVVAAAARDIFGERRCGGGSECSSAVAEVQQSADEESVANAVPRRSRTSCNGPSAVPERRGLEARKTTTSTTTMG